MTGRQRNAGDSGQMDRCPPSPPPSNDVTGGPILRDNGRRTDGRSPLDVTDANPFTSNTCYCERQATQ